MTFRLPCGSLSPRPKRDSLGWLVVKCTNDKLWTNQLGAVPGSITPLAPPRRWARIRHVNLIIFAFGMDDTKHASMNTLWQSHFIGTTPPSINLEEFLRIAGHRVW